MQQMQRTLLLTIFSMFILVTAAFKAPNRREFLLQGAAMVGLVSKFSTPNARAEALGYPAPPFHLPSNMGDEIGLDDLARGGEGYTVLYFYPADNSQGCAEAQGFEKKYAQFKKLNAQIIGISVDPIYAQIDFASTCGLEFPLLSDEDGLVSYLYGSAVPRRKKIRNRTGFVAKRQTYIISPRGRILKVFKDVESNLENHADEVEQALKTIVFTKLSTLSTL